MKLVDRVKNIDYSIIDSSDSIFHYTKVKTAIERILFYRNIRLNTFSNTNDPLEYNKRFLGVQTNYDSDHSITNNGFEAKHLLENIMLKNSYFLSTCTNSYKKNEISSCGYLKSRMWSQYGDNHEGVLFVLSKDNIISEVCKKYSNQDFFIQYKKVKYYSNNGSLYGTTMIDANKIGTKSLIDYSIQYIENYSNRLFFVKQDDYKDENEYRFLVIDKKVRNGVEIVVPLERVVKAIIVGDRFHKAYYPCLEKLNKKFNFPFFKLQWFSNRFLLDKLF